MKGLVSMNKPFKAEIMSIGSELLRGEITDTNAMYIASQLPVIGIELQKITTAGDDIKMLSEAFSQALGRCNLIITTGGLGPTADDLTREAIALSLDEKLFLDPTLETDLKAIFIRAGREMPKDNIQQAMRIPSAVSLPNPKGTAPGWWVEKNGKVIVVMPGPPNEMRPMWQNEALPRLKKRFPGEKIMIRTIKTFSIPEATVGELIMPFFKANNPSLGIYAKPDGIQVRLISQGEGATQLLDTTEMKIKQLLSPYVWGTNDDTLEGIIGQELSKRGMSLATVEGFTGGLLGHLITDSPLSSQYYRGGLIVNSELTEIGLEIPANVIQVKGTVSKAAAETMAVSIKEQFSTDFGLSITGITKDIKSTNQSDIAYIGIADAEGTQSWQQQFMPDRADSRERAAVAALFRLRERLIATKILDNAT
jgi:nicotinamide-nucleotide amidase